MARDGCKKGKQNSTNNTLCEAYVWGLTIKGCVKKWEAICNKKINFVRRFGSEWQEIRTKMESNMQQKSS